MRRKTIIEEIQRQREMMGLITEAGGENPVTLIRRVIQSAKEVGDNDITKYFGKEAAEDLERLGIKNLDELDLKLTNGVRDLPVGFEPRMLGRGGVVDALIPNLVKDVSRRIFTDPSMGWVAKRIVGDYFGQFGNKQLSDFGNVIMKLDLTNPNVIGRSDVQQYLKKAKNAFEQVLGPEEDFTKWFNNYYAKQLEDGSFVGADKTGLKLDTPTKTDLDPTAPKTGEEPTPPKTGEEPTPPKTGVEADPDDYIRNQAEYEPKPSKKTEDIQNEARQKAKLDLDPNNEDSDLNQLMRKLCKEAAYKKLCKKYDDESRGLFQRASEELDGIQNMGQLSLHMRGKLDQLKKLFPNEDWDTLWQKYIKMWKGTVMKQKGVSGKWEFDISAGRSLKGASIFTGHVAALFLVNGILSFLILFISRITSDETTSSSDIVYAFTHTCWNMALGVIEGTVGEVKGADKFKKKLGIQTNTPPSSTNPNAKYMNNLDDFKKYLDADGIVSTSAVSLGGDKYKTSNDATVEYQWKELDKDKKLGTFE